MLEAVIKMLLELDDEKLRYIYRILLKLTR